MSDHPNERLYLRIFACCIIFWLDYGIHATGLRLDTVDDGHRKLTLEGAEPQRGRGHGRAKEPSRRSFGAEATARRESRGGEWSGQGGGGGRMKL